jgi:hypothetical protein
MVKAFAIAIALFTFFLVSCQNRNNPHDPAAFPVGFAEATIPSVELTAYLYFSQPTPSEIPWRLFLGPNNSHDTDIQFTVDSISLWIGPDMDSFGGLLIFKDSSQAERLEELLNSPEHSHIWHSRNTYKLFFVNGDSPWSVSLRHALAQGTTTSIQAYYPDIWNTLALLPSSSNGIPWAAGFTKVDPAPIDFLASGAKMDLTGVTPALGGANIDHLAFALYSQETLKLPHTLTPEWMRASGLGSIVVAKSGYPGFLVSLMMGSFLGQGGLDKYPLESEDVYYGTLGEIEKAHVMVKNFGATLYVTLGLDQEQVKALMTAILASHNP